MAKADAGTRLGAIAETVCAVLLVAVVWASAHYVVLPVSYVWVGAFELLALTLGVCAAFAVVAWRACVGYRTVYGVFAAIVAVGTICSLVSRSGVSVGGDLGIGALLVGAVLVRYHPQRALRVLCAGLATASALYPLAHLAAQGDDTLMSQVLTLAALCLGGLYLAIAELRGTAGNGERVTAREAWAQGRDEPVIAVLSQTRAIAAIVALLLLFFVGFGVFETFAISRGAGYPVSALMIVLVAMVAVAIAVVDRFFPISGWVTPLVAALVALFIAGLLMVVLANDLPTTLFGLMYTASAVVHILVWVILVRLARGKASLAVFLFAVTTGSLYFAQMGGHLLMRLVISSMGFDSFRVSVVAAILLAALTLCMGAILVRESKGDDAPTAALGELLATGGDTEVASDPAPSGRAPEKAKEPAPAEDPDMAAFALVGERFGLSEQETAVMRLYARGRSVRVISEQLNLAQSTIRTYIQRLYGKLDVHDKQGMLDVIESCRTSQRQ